MRRRWIAILTVVAACVAVLLAQLPASAINPGGTSASVTGNATWFTGLGSPYGGCGLPQSALDSQNFLALNVQNSPGNYSNLPRPIPAADAAEIGMWDNGLNCGRWVKVTIGPNCNGTNDGAPNEPFCRGGAGYVADQYDGATLDMVVGDSCDDDNAWCKDDPYHVDLAQASLNKFVLNGQPVGSMYPGSWNNRQVTWQFESAPNYTGDISIGAIQGAQPYWAAIAISHLPNGIHGVQYFANGAWASATMDSDQGDDYIISPTTGAGTAGSQYEIRVIDASGNLVNNGEVYNFGLPAACVPNGCSAAYTAVSYTSSTSPTPTPTPTPTATPTRARRLRRPRRRLQHPRPRPAGPGRLVRADLHGHQLVARRLPAAAHCHQQGHRGADRVDDRVQVRRHGRDHRELLERHRDAKRAAGHRRQREL